MFACDVEVHSFADFGRSDGPPDAIGHGQLSGGPVALFASDVAGDEAPLRCDGMMLALLGTAAPETLRGWFACPSEAGAVLD